MSRQPILLEYQPFERRLTGGENGMKRALALLSFAVCAGPLAAAELAAKADPAKGQSIANKICAPCHGADGNSPTPANPKLANQVPEYLEKQLANFKPAAGKRAERENPIMGSMVAGLSVEDMRDVAAYYATQQAKPGAVRNRDAFALGRKIWRGGDVAKGLPACAACHGASGAGLPAQYPRLAGQYAEYTEAQLKAFRSGERRNDANKMMQAIAAKMSDPEIRAVTDYIAGLR
jgi:cytochrome c553